MKKKRNFSGLKAFMCSAVAMALSATIGSSVQAATFADTSGHWAESAIERWASYDVIAGYNGYFRPDDPITRGDMAVIINRIMDYQIESARNYTDLDENYYTSPIRKLNSAGFMEGFENTIRPKDFITREEAAVVIANAMHLDVRPTTDGTYETTFTDNYQIAYWSKNSIYMLHNLGALNGRSTNYFEPQVNITRAEVAYALDKLIEEFIYEKEGYSINSVNGTVVINEAGVSLENMTITGNLILAEGIADGDIYLDNINVKGNIIIKGGSTNTIYVDDVTCGGRMEVSRVDAATLVKMRGSSDIPVIDIYNDCTVDGSRLDYGNSLGDITIYPDAENVTILGNVDSVTNESPGCDITLGGTFGSVDMNEQGTVNDTSYSAGSKVDVNKIPGTTADLAPGIYINPVFPNSYASAFISVSDPTIDVESGDVEVFIYVSSVANCDLMSVAKNAITVSDGQDIDITVADYDGGDETFGTTVYQVNFTVARNVERVELDVNFALISNAPDITVDKNFDEVDSTKTPSASVKITEIEEAEDGLVTMTLIVSHMEDCRLPLDPAKAVTINPASGKDLDDYPEITVVEGYGSTSTLTAYQISFYPDKDQDTLPLQVNFLDSDSESDFSDVKVTVNMNYPSYDKDEDEEPKAAYEIKSLIDDIDAGVTSFRLQITDMEYCELPEDDDLAITCDGEDELSVVTMIDTGTRRYFYISVPYDEDRTKMEIDVNFVDDAQAWDGDYQITSEGDNYDFLIKIDDSETFQMHGDIKLDGGEKVTIYPESGETLHSVQILSDSILGVTDLVENSDGSWTFTMPSSDVNLFVSNTATTSTMKVIKGDGSDNFEVYLVNDNDIVDVGVNNAFTAMQYVYISAEVGYKFDGTPKAEDSSGKAVTMTKVGDYFYAIAPMTGDVTVTISATKDTADYYVPTADFTKGTFEVKRLIQFTYFASALNSQIEPGTSVYVCPDFSEYDIAAVYGEINGVKNYLGTVANNYLTTNGEVDLSYPHAMTSDVEFSVEYYKSTELDSTVSYSAYLQGVPGGNTARVTVTPTSAADPYTSTVTVDLSSASGWKDGMELRDAKSLGINYAPSSAVGLQFASARTGITINGTTATFQIRGAVTKDAHVTFVLDFGDDAGQNDDLEDTTLTLNSTANVYGLKSAPTATATVGVDNDGKTFTVDISAMQQFNPDVDIFDKVEVKFSPDATGVEYTSEYDETTQKLVVTLTGTPSVDTEATLDIYFKQEEVEEEEEEEAVTNVINYMTDDGSVTSTLTMTNITTKETIKPAQTQVKAGDYFSVNVECNTHKTQVVVTTGNYDDEGGTKLVPIDGGNVYQMPADVAYVYVYYTDIPADEYAVNFGVHPPGLEVEYTATIDGVNNTKPTSETAKAGEKVHVFVTPLEGYTLSFNLTPASVDVTETMVDGKQVFTFTMPEAAVSATMFFTEDKVEEETPEEYDITLQVESVKDTDGKTLAFTFADQVVPADNVVTLTTTADLSNYTVKSVTFDPNNVVSLNATISASVGEDGKSIVFVTKQEKLTKDETVKVNIVLEEKPVATHTVTFNEDQFTASVDGTAINTGDSVEEGKTVILTPQENGEIVETVYANGSAITANSNGTYSHVVVGNVNFTVDYEVPEGSHRVNIVGDLKVTLADETEIANGEYVADGTVVTLTPVDGQVVTSLTANDVDVALVDGAYTYTVTDSVVFVVTYENTTEYSVTYAPTATVVSDGSVKSYAVTVNEDRTTATIAASAIADLDLTADHKFTANATVAVVPDGGSTTYTVRVSAVALDSNGDIVITFAESAYDTLESNVAVTFVVGVTSPSEDQTTTYTITPDHVDVTIEEDESVTVENGAFSAESGKTITVNIGDSSLDLDKDYKLVITAGSMKEEIVIDASTLTFTMPSANVTLTIEEVETATPEDKLTLTAEVVLIGTDENSETVTASSVVWNETTKIATVYLPTTHNVTGYTMNAVASDKTEVVWNESATTTVGSSYIEIPLTIDADFASAVHLTITLDEGVVETLNYTIADVVVVDENEDPIANPGIAKPTVANATNLTATAGVAVSGDALIVTAATNSDYDLTVTITDADGESVLHTTTSSTFLYHITSDITITATYKQKTEEQTVENNGTYDFDISYGSTTETVVAGGSTTVPGNTTITILPTAEITALGGEIHSVTQSGGTDGSANNTVDVALQNVYITVEYKYPIEVDATSAVDVTYTVTPEAGEPEVGYGIPGTSGNPTTVTLTGADDKTVASFELNGEQQTGNSFEMPAEKATITKVTYAYTVTAKSNLDSSIITYEYADNSQSNAAQTQFNDGESVASGKYVKLTIDPKTAEASSYAVYKNGILANTGDLNASTNAYLFEMGDEDVTITVIYFQEVTLVIVDNEANGTSPVNFSYTLNAFTEVVPTDVSLSTTEKAEFPIGAVVEVKPPEVIDYDAIVTGGPVDVSNNTYFTMGTDETTITVTYTNQLPEVQFTANSIDLIFEGYYNNTEVEKAQVQSVVTPNVFSYDKETRQVTLDLSAEEFDENYRYFYNLVVYSTSQKELTTSGENYDYTTKSLVFTLSGDYDQATDGTALDIDITFNRDVLTWAYVTKEDDSSFMHVTKVEYKGANEYEITVLANGTEIDITDQDSVYFDGVDGEHVSVDSVTRGIIDGHDSYVITATIDPAFNASQSGAANPTTFDKFVAKTGYLLTANTETGVEYKITVIPAGAIESTVYDSSAGSAVPSAGVFVTSGMTVKVEATTAFGTEPIVTVAGVALTPELISSDATSELVTYSYPGHTVSGTTDIVFTAKVVDLSDKITVSAVDGADGNKVVGTITPESVTYANGDVTITFKDGSVEGYRLDVSGSHSLVDSNDSINVNDNLDGTYSTEITIAYSDFIKGGYELQLEHEVIETYTLTLFDAAANNALSYSIEDKNTGANITLNGATAEIPQGDTITITVKNVGYTPEEFATYRNADVLWYTNDITKSEAIDAIDPTANEFTFDVVMSEATSVIIYGPTKGPSTGTPAPTPTVSITVDGVSDSSSYTTANTIDDATSSNTGKILYRASSTGVWSVYAAGSNTSLADSMEIWTNQAEVPTISESAFPSTITLGDTTVTTGTTIEASSTHYMTVGENVTLAATVTIDTTHDAQTNADTITASPAAASIQITGASGTGAPDIGVTETTSNEEVTIADTFVGSGTETDVSFTFTGNDTMNPTLAFSNGGD